jgi:hypothetical protein
MTIPGVLPLLGWGDRRQMSPIQANRRLKKPSGKISGKKSDAVLTNFVANSYISARKWTQLIFPRSQPPTKAVFFPFRKVG